MAILIKNEIKIIRKEYTVTTNSGETLETLIKELKQIPLDAKLVDIKKDDEVNDVCISFYLDVAIFE